MVERLPPTVCLKGLPIKMAVVVYMVVCVVYCPLHAFNMQVLFSLNCSCCRYAEIIVMEGRRVVLDWLL